MSSDYRSSDELDHFKKVQKLSDRIKDEGAALDTLIALIECGPVYDGDVPSKSGRDLLFALGMAIRCVAATERNGWSDGYQVANCLGRDVYKYLFGESTTLLEAKAFRQAGLAIRKLK